MLCLAAVLLASPRAARADDEGPPVDLALFVGATGFSGAAARAMLDAAADVELRIGVESRTGLGLELAYADSLHGVRDPSMPDAALRGVSGELGLRWSPVSAVVQPYLTLGLRETYYRVVDWSGSSRISILDYVTQVPVGLGVTFRWGRTFADLRGTYRFAFDEDLLDAGRDSLDTWSASAGVGVSL